MKTKHIQKDKKAKSFNVWLHKLESSNIPFQTLTLGSFDDSKFFHIYVSDNTCTTICMVFNEKGGHVYNYY